MPEIQQIEFHVEVRAGSALKNVAVRSAKKFKATWVILDRSVNIFCQFYDFIFGTFLNEQINY